MQTNKKWIYASFNNGNHVESIKSTVGLDL